MSNEDSEDDDVQRRLVEFMEAAQKPQPPLGNSELVAIREIIKGWQHRKWLRKQLFILLPWIASMTVAIAGGWNWLLSLLKGSH